MTGFTATAGTAHDKSRHLRSGGCGVARRGYRIAMKPHLIALVLGLPALILTPLPAVAEVRALLIGVGDYLHLDADLQGPPNDVALMAQVLTERGVAASRITALTTAPDHPDLPQGLRRGLPDRAAIMAELDRLTQETVPGDTVLFYFSGHGSQAPDLNGDEGGGADEILLPRDASGWNGAVAMVGNAIVDDELHDWAQGLTGRGVRLIAILDACHSGTGFRAAGGQGVAREIAPDLLGIPDDLPDPPLTRPDPGLTGGGFAFLYSSQPDQRSFEFPLAAGQPWHGAFTLALARALRSLPDASWEQMLTIARQEMRQGSVRQDPDGEGPLLQAAVFGGLADLPQRYPATGAELTVGLLEGLTEGSEVALFETPSGGAPVAHARLAALTARSAQLDPLDAHPLPRGGWVEVTSPAPPPPLRLAPLPEGASPAAQQAIAGALAAGLAVEDAARPDLVPVETGGVLAFALSDGVLDPKGPGSTLRARPRADETLNEATARLLENAAHSLRTRAVLAGMAGRGLGIGGPPLTLEVERRAGKRTGGACRASGPETAHDPARGVADCDELWLTVTNRSGSAQDVTVLYLAQDFTITPIWPVRNLSNRLGLGESARIGLRIEATTPDAAAQEEILVLALPPDARGRRGDLTALATPDRLRDLPRTADCCAPSETLLSAVGVLLDPETGGANRGFALRRPSLTLLSQPVAVLAPSRP
ncbi:caspase family protein [Szabonella alba]|uniref:Caspase family protein n=1 Tax=Szabonella alba TaxID=2804194 RepID=A0A8K0VBF4_9RHOB|nr:caspase family protein [Szabonella alba]MBL4916167.1 caspase family protein [Szabonella alba]